MTWQAENLDRDLRRAVRHFWTTRHRQADQQGAASGERDRGGRTAVTGGRQLDGFVHLVESLLAKAGVPGEAISTGKRERILPGFFRPEKEWDLVVVVDGVLLGVVEFKSQVGSFGNNYNNRTEEAIGSATDLLTAYREGAFRPSAKPWLGYLMLLEETARSTAPVAVKESHFQVFDEFRDNSYAQRYEITLTKLVRERLYDAACLLLSGASEGRRRGQYREPSAELSFRRLAASLVGRAVAHLRS